MKTKWRNTSWRPDGEQFKTRLRDTEINQHWLFNPFVHVTWGQILYRKLSQPASCMICPLICAWLSQHIGYHISCNCKHLQSSNLLILIFCLVTIFHELVCDHADSCCTALNHPRRACGAWGFVVARWQIVCITVVMHRNLRQTCVLATRL